jgi:spermidine dehydrogenase
MSHINPRRARELGMGRPISRRDFFDGIAMTAGVAALGSALGCGPSSGEPGVIGTPELEVPIDVTFPPALTGLQGNTAQALSVPHAMRDDRFWEYAGTPESTGETYDLVVVGGGISGVSAAYEWLRREPRARILILDNHDEIGGHARRTEFNPEGRKGPLVGYGGSQSIEAPSAWTPEGKQLLDQLGIQLQKFDKYFDQKLYPGLKMYDSVMCDQETFPVEKLVRLPPGITAEQWVVELPIAAQAKRDLVRLYTNPPDWFPGLSQEQKQRRLADLTYSGFLLEVCKAHPDVEKFLRSQSNDDWAYTTQAFGAIDAWGSSEGWDYPGFQGLKLDAAKPSRFNSPSMIKEWDANDPYIYHFPEGNQALVRMMLARMIPGFASASGMDRITTADFNYNHLDLAANRVRFRLSSPVVLAENDGPPGSATSATVGYFDGERIRTVRADSVIMACWNMVIPFLVPTLPVEQKQAMRQAVKMPMLYATVQVRNWEPWRKIGVHHTRWTGAYWTVSQLDYPVSMPDYAFPKDPGEPANVQLIAAPCASQMGPSAGAVSGRHTLLGTPYSYMEYSIRDQLTRLLSPGGFDPEKDIQAITVNRWGHGYSPEYCRPWDAFYPDGPFPADLARRQHGRIAIANADSIPAAYADAAITAAFRAVSELSA